MWRTPANCNFIIVCVFLYLQKLRTLWSNRLGELVKDVFLTSVPAQSKLPAQRCKELWLDLEQELAAELKQAECTTKLQLEAMRAQLDLDGQVETMWQIIKYFKFNFLTFVHVHEICAGVQWY